MITSGELLRLSVVAVTEKGGSTGILLTPEWKIHSTTERIYPTAEAAKDAILVLQIASFFVIYDKEQSLKESQF